MWLKVYGDEQNHARKVKCFKLAKNRAGDGDFLISASPSSGRREDNWYASVQQICAQGETEKRPALPDFNPARELESPAGQIF